MLNNCDFEPTSSSPFHRGGERDTERLQDTVRGTPAHRWHITRGNSLCHEESRCICQVSPTQAPHGLQGHLPFPIWPWSFSDPQCPVVSAEALSTCQSPYPLLCDFLPSASPLLPGSSAAPTVSLTCEMCSLGNNYVEWFTTNCIG